MLWPLRGGGGPVPVPGLDLHDDGLITVPRHDVQFGLGRTDVATHEFEPGSQERARGDLLPDLAECLRGERPALPVTGGGGAGAVMGGSPNREPRQDPARAESNQRVEGGTGQPAPQGPGDQSSFAVLGSRTSWIDERE